MKTEERLVTERNRRLLLRRRPVGLPVTEDFDLVEEAIPKPGDGAILVRNHLCSLDPGIRGWLEEGLLVIDEHIEEGIENAVPAFLRLFSGTHEGKLILRIAA